MVRKTKTMNGNQQKKKSENGEEKKNQFSFNI